MVRLGLARVKVWRMYCAFFVSGGFRSHLSLFSFSSACISSVYISTYLVDELLYPCVQFVLLAGALLDLWEGLAETIGGGASHVVDEVCEVFWALELNLAVGRVGLHVGWSVSM